MIKVNILKFSLKLTILSCFIASSALNLPGQTGDKVMVGDFCPSFTLNSGGIKKVINVSNLKGSVTLINFFATWCGPCLQELPELDRKIWEKYKGNKTFNLMVIGRGHGEKEIEAFKNKHSYDFPMYADTSKSVYNNFADKYIPRNYIINREGKIVYAAMNYNPLEFAKLLQKLEEELK